MIELQQVTYGENPPADGLSFSLSEVGLHGLLFLRASEQTRLNACLSGLCRPHSGTLLLHKKGNALPPCSAVGQVGYVPAAPALYLDMTASELLDFVGEAKGVEPDRRYRQIKEALTLTELESVANKTVGRLSPFGRRRLALAAAVLGNPAALLVEEPLADLNKAQLRTMEELLRTLGRVKPVILTSREPAILSLCEDARVIARGKVIYEGDPSTLSQALEGDGSPQALCEYFGFEPEEEQV